MARNQKNFGLSAYIDDNAGNWNKRGETGGAFAGVDGHAASNATYNIWIESPRNRARTVTAMDATTGRTVKAVIYTPTAFGAIHKGDSVSVDVAGLATTVTYTVIAKNAERTPGVPNFTTQLADA